MTHTFVNKIRIPNTPNSVDNSTTITGSIPRVGSDTLVVAMLLYAGGSDRTGGAPTLGAQPMTQASTRFRGTTSPECTIEMWYLNNPIGPHTSASWLSVPNAGGINMSIDVATARAQTGSTTALDFASGSAGATSASPRGTIDFSSGSDIIFAAVANGANTFAPYSPTGTVIYTNDNGIWGGGSQYFFPPSTGSTTSGSWGFGTSEDWGVVIASFKDKRTSLVVSNTTQAQTADNITLTYNAETPPTTTLGTPNEGYSTTASTVDLKFTGIDYTGHRLDYQVQVATDKAFDTIIQVDQVAPPVEFVGGPFDITFPTPPTPGALVVVALGQWETSANGISKVEDNQGNTYYEAKQKSVGIITSGIFYAENVISSGTFTITVTLNTATIDSVGGAVSYTGARKTSSIIGTSASNSGTGTNATSGSITSTTGSALYFSTLTYELQTSASIVAPWNERLKIGAGAAFCTILTEDQMAIGEKTASFTIESSAAWVTTIAAFKSGSSIVVDAFSTDHTGFSAGASHPTNSGVEQTYTTQTPLTAGTYYWRVRATDSTTDGTYSGWGGWSGSKSFIIEGTISLVIQNATQTQNSDKIVLQPRNIYLNNVIQTQTSDKVSLTQHYVLATNNSTQLQSSDKVVLSAHYILTSVKNATQTQNSDKIVLQPRNIYLNNVIQTQTSDKVSLTQHYILTVNNATQTQTSDKVTITYNPSTTYSAIGINASGDYVKFVGAPEAFSMTGNTDKCTIAGWMKVRDITPGAWAYNLGFENDDTTSTYSVLHGYRDTDVAELASTAENHTWVNQPSQDTWYYFYITGANNGTNYIVWKGGYYTASGSAPVEAHTNSIGASEFNVQRISVANDSYNEVLDSCLAYVRVWTGVELTDAELRTERNSATAVKTSGLWADWKLSNNTDTTDYSGGGHTLTFGGTITSEDGPPLQPTLSVNNATQTQTAGGVALTQHQVLVINSTSQAQTVDGNVLTFTEIEDIVLIVHYSLVTNNSTQSQTSNNIVLTQHQVLSVNNCVQAQTSDNINLTFYPPTGVLEINNASQLQLCDGANSFGSSPVTDDFNRASLGTNWTTISGTPSISSNQLITSSTGTTNLRWNVSDFGPAVDMYITGSGLTAVSQSLYLYYDYVDGTHFYEVYLQAASLTGCSHFALYAGAGLVIDVGALTWASRASIKYGVRHKANGDFTLYIDRGSGWEVVTTGNDTSMLTRGAAVHQFYKPATVPTNSYDDFSGRDLYLLELTHHPPLPINNATQLQTSNNVVLSAHYIIIPNNASQLQTSDNVALTQHQVLAINNVTQLQTSDNINLTQDYVLSINNVTQLQTSTNVNLTQHQVLTINNVTQLQTSDKVNLTQDYVLFINSATQLQTSANVNLTQHQVLAINNATQLQTSQTINLTQHQVLTINNATQTQTSTLILLTNHTILTGINNSTQLQTSNNVDLLQHQVGAVAPFNAIQTQTSENIALTQHQILAIDNAVQTQTSTNANAKPHYDLTINNTTQSQTSNKVNLIQDYILSINNATQLQTSDKVNLTQHYVLSINNTTQIQTSDKVNLTQHQVLAVNNATQTQTSDNITLTTTPPNFILAADYVLSDAGLSTVNGYYNNSGILNGRLYWKLSTDSDIRVWWNGSIWIVGNYNTSTTYYYSTDNVRLPELATSWIIFVPGGGIIPPPTFYSTMSALQTQTADNVTLTFNPGISTITVQNAVQAQTSSNIILTQHYILSVNNAVQLQTANKIDLVQHEVGSLNINNAVQTQTTSTINLTQHHVLSINSAVQTQTTSNIGLTQHHVIVIQNTVQLQTAQNVSLTQHQVLTINNATQLQTAGNVDLIQHTIGSLNVNNATQLQTSTNVNLIQHQVLAMQNATQLQTASNISLFYNFTLAINNTTQLQTAQSVNLTQDYVLSVNNATQLQTAGNVNLIQHQILAMQNATQLQTADNVDLSAHYVLATVNNATQLQTSNKVSLLAHYALATVNNATQLQTSSSLLLKQNYLLAIQNATQLQTSSTIISRVSISIDNATQLQFADSLTIFFHGQHYILDIFNALQGQSADNINLKVWTIVFLTAYMLRSMQGTTQIKTELDKPSYLVRDMRGESYLSESLTDDTYIDKSIQGTSYAYKRKI